jgi:hypothetical protein
LVADAVFGVVVDDFHADQQLELRIPPGLAGLTMHQAKDAVLVVDDPIQPPPQMNRAALGSQRLPVGLGRSQLRGNLRHLVDRHVRDHPDHRAVCRVAHLDDRSAGIAFVLADSGFFGGGHGSALDADCSYRAHHRGFLNCRPLMLTGLIVQHGHALFVVFDFEHVGRGHHALPVKFAPAAVNNDFHCLSILLGQAGVMVTGSW